MYIFAIAIALASVLAQAVPGNLVEGTLRVNGMPVTLKHVRAHLHDNAEGLISRKKELPFGMLVGPREEVLWTDAHVAFLAFYHLVIAKDAAGAFAKD